ncbi:hypothetical protein ZWY2020_000838 [Hordeum vulgare]|nr:hypothetical protein ZWY2020_000838 [Hordeum vulgare]
MRHQMPEGSPPEEGRRGPEGRALVHLLLTKDYTPPSPDLAPPVEWPRIFRYEVDLGAIDGRPAVAARSSCGSARHTRRREDDADDEGHDRHRRRRRGPRQRSLWQNVLSQTQCRDTSSFHPAPRRDRHHGDGRRHGVREGRHRAPSRSPSEARRWHTSPSPTPASRRVDSESSFTIVPAGSIRRRASRPAGVDGQADRLPPAALEVPSGREENPAGSMAELVAAALAACVRQRLRCSQPTSRRSLGRSPDAGLQAAPEVAVSPLDEVLVAAGAGNLGQQEASQYGKPAHPSVFPGNEEVPLQFPKDVQAMRQLGGGSMPGLLGAHPQLQGMPQHGQPDPWSSRSQALGMHQCKEGISADWGRRLHQLLYASVTNSIWAPPPFEGLRQANAAAAAQPLHVTRDKEVLFGPGVQQQPDPIAQDASARSALLEANLSGMGLLSAVTNSVSDLHLDEQWQFLSQLIAAMPSSVLGAPPATTAKATTATAIKKKVLAPFSRRTSTATSLRPSMTSTRRTQARVCKALGLISNEEQFKDDTLQNCLSFFKDPMSSAQAERLGQLAGLAAPASIQLPDSDLQAILEDEMARAA